jgi:hypothetical protein
VWGAGCGVHSGRAPGREPASDWPPEGMPQAADADAGASRRRARTRKGRRLSAGYDEREAGGMAWPELKTLSGS